MKEKQLFKVGDTIEWCSAKGHVSGVILKFIPPRNYEVCITPGHSVIVDERSIVSAIIAASSDVLLPGDVLILKNEPKVKFFNLKVPCVCHYSVDFDGGNLVVSINRVEHDLL